MKTIIAISAITAFLFAACQPGQSTETPTKAEAGKTELTKESLKSTSDKLCYSIGADIGKSLKRDEMPLNKEAFIKGIEDAMKEGEMLFTDEELRAIKNEHRKAKMDARRKKQEEAGKKNKVEGEKFLEENKSKEGVIVLENGLQYKILTEGKGPKPEATDKVSVNYKGTLIDGKEFDSSYKRGKPAEFGVSRVVKGWTQALQLMPVGSKWQLFIPSELAYGDRGAGRDIGPSSVLIFEIELVSIVDAKK